MTEAGARRVRDALARVAELRRAADGGGPTERRALAGALAEVLVVLRGRRDAVTVPLAEELVGVAEGVAVDDAAQRVLAAQAWKALADARFEAAGGQPSADAVMAAEEAVWRYRGLSGRASVDARAEFADALRTAGWCFSCLGEETFAQERFHEEVSILTELATEDLEGFGGTLAAEMLRLRVFQVPDEPGALAAALTRVDLLRRLADWHPECYDGELVRARRWLEAVAALEGMEAPSQPMPRSHPGPLTPERRAEALAGARQRGAEHPRLQASAPRWGDPRDMAWRAAMVELLMPFHQAASVEEPEWRAVTPIVTEALELLWTGQTGDVVEEPERYAVLPSGALWTGHTARTRTTGNAVDLARRIRESAPTEPGEATCSVCLILAEHLDWHRVPEHELNATATDELTGIVDRAILRADVHAAPLTHPAKLLLQQELHDFTSVLDTADDGNVPPDLRDRVRTAAAEIFRLVRAGRRA